MRADRQFLKGLGSQKSFLQWCEPKVGTQQRSLLMLKLKSAAERRMGELCRRSELSGEQNCWDYINEMKCRALWCTGEFLPCVGGLWGSEEMKQLGVFVRYRMAVAGRKECQILPWIGGGEQERGWVLLEKALMRCHLE